MIEVNDNRITDIPRDYYDWIKDLNTLQIRNVSDAELELVCRGECAAVQGAMSFLEGQIIKTVNSMLNRAAKQFSREFEQYTMYGSYDNLHIIFIRFSKRVKKCTFFCDISFLRSDFKLELYDSVRSEAKRLWDSVLNALHSQNLDIIDTCLEEELYMIKRISLIDERRRMG